MAVSGALRAAPAWLVAAALAVLVSGGLLGLRAAALLEPLELAAYDRLLRWTRPAGEGDPRLLLVRIQESDIQKYGHPLSDETLTRALRVLLDAGPRAISVDLFRDHPIPPGETELERLLVAHREIVVIEKIGEADRDPVAPPIYLAGTDQVGFSDVSLDRDGRVRRALLLMHGEGAGRISLAAQVAFRYLASEQVVPHWNEPASASDAVPTLALGEAPLPRFQADDGGYEGADAGGYQILLAHWRGRPGFDSITLDELLTGALAPQTARERVVLLGTSATSVHDRLESPFGEITGLEHHAQVVSELLNRALAGAHGVRTLADRKESALVLLFGIAGGLLAAWLRSPWTLPAAALATLALLGLGSAALFAAGWWLPVVPASLAFAVSGGMAVAYVSLDEARERRRVMDLFGRFLARDVAEAIWRDRDAFLDGGRPRARTATITVLLVDLSGYTALAEAVDPQRLMAWIGEYLEAMAQVVGAHGGIVDDYAGDGLKANFGVPLPRSTPGEVDADAAAAVACALAFESEIERLNRRWGELGYPPARVRVGLHTGPAVIGIIGSAERMKYTSVGDTVNTAARLESWNREEFRAEGSALRVLASEETFRRLGGVFAAEELGKVELKGRSEPVVVHRIRGRNRSEGETS